MSYEEKEGQVVIKNNNIIMLIIGIALTIIGLYLLSKKVFNPESNTSWGIVGMVVFGVIFILTWKREYLTVSRVVGSIDFKIKSLFSVKEESCSINEVASVEYNEYAQENPRLRFEKVGRYSTSQKLFIVFKDGRILPVPHEERGNNVKGLGTEMIRRKSMDRYIELGKKLANFLGVPFAERRPPTIGEALSMIKDQVQDSIEDAQMRKEQQLNKRNGQF